MKKIVLTSVVLFLFSGLLFASGVEGKWTATIKTENGDFTFYADYVVKDNVITGKLTSDMGSVDIKNGKIEGDSFEYTFEIDYNTIKHKGTLTDGVLKIKSSGDYGESEFEMKRVEKE